MAGEPWCFSPAVLARLTDDQIGELYFAPRDDKGQLIPPIAVQTAKVQTDDAVPDRATFVAEAVAEFGQTPEHWHAVYDKMEEKLKHGDPG